MCNDVSLVVSSKGVIMLSGNTCETGPDGDSMLEM